MQGATKLSWGEFLLMLVFLFTTSFTCRILGLDGWRLLAGWIFASMLFTPIWMVRQRLGIGQRRA